MYDGKIDGIMKVLFFNLFKRNELLKELYGKRHIREEQFAEFFCLPSRCFPPSRRANGNVITYYKVGSYVFKELKHAKELIDMYEKISKKAYLLNASGPKPYVLSERHTTVKKIHVLDKQAKGKLADMKLNAYVYNNLQKSAAGRCWLAYASYSVLRDIYGMLRYAKHGVEYAKLCPEDGDPVRKSGDYKEPYKYSSKKDARSARRRIQSDLSDEAMLSRANYLLQDWLPKSNFRDIILEHSSEVFKHTLESNTPVPADLVLLIKHDLIEEIRKSASSLFNDMENIKKEMLVLRDELWGKEDR